MRLAFRRILISALLTFSLFSVLSLSSIYAGAPTINTSVASNTCHAATATSFTCSATLTAGHVVIVGIGYLIAGHPGVPTLTVSDSQSNTFTLIISRVCSGCGDTLVTYLYDIASAASSGSDTFTFSWTGGNAAQLGADIYDLNNAATTGIVSSQGDGFSAGTMSSSVASFTSVGLTIGQVLCDGCTGNYVAGSGFQLITNQPNFPTAGNAIMSQFSSTAGSGSTCPATNSAGSSAWAEVCAGIPISGAGSGICTSATTCTATATVQVGNVVVVAIQWSTEPTGVLTVTDSLGNSYIARIPSIEFTSCDASGCINGHTVSTSLWDSLITVAGAATITVTMSGSTSTISVIVYSIANVNPAPTCVAAWSTTTGVTSTVIATSTPCSSTAGSSAIASIGALGAFALTGGAGFTMTTQGASNNFGAQIGTIVGNTVFPASVASATVVSEVAMILGPIAAGGSVGLGSCPTKNTGTNALTNSTVYFWTGTALANEQVNTLQTEIASVNSGHVSSETLALGVYATPGAGSVSVNNPLTLIGNSFKFFTLTPTSAPQLLSWAANVNLGTNGIVSGATIAIAIQGNSKILINSSSLSGMQTASGTIGAGNQFTALSNTATQLFFCGQLTFQVVVTTTTTLSTTTTISSTFTTTINQAGVVTNTNAYLALLIIVALFLIMAKVAGLPGAMLGAIVGIIVVIVGGFLTGAPAYIAIVLIGIGSLAVIFSRLSNSGNAGGGM